MHLLIAKALAAGFSASVAVTGTALLQSPHTTTLVAALYAIPSVEQQSPLDQWIEKLTVLESEGRENLKIVDVNGYHSYGCLQFQMATFEAYGTRYGLLKDGADLKTFIFDCSLQKAIAKQMIEENSANWRHWFTSVKVKKLGFPPKEEEFALLSLSS